MGAWGFKAWENDGAADWCAELHEQTGLRDHVVATLRSGCRVQGEGAVRAAAHVMRKLAHVYRWPVRSIESDLRLAVQALGEVRACYALRLAQAHKSESKSKSKRDLNKGLKQVDAEIMRLQERLTEMEDRRREREARKMERDNG